VTLALALTVWLGSMFVYSAGMKLAQYSRAGGLLTPYAVLPRQLSVPAGYLLPWAELTAGALLLLGVLYPMGPLLAIGLATAFGYGSARVLSRGVRVPCGCTSGGDPVTRQTVVRAVAIATAGVYLLGTQPPQLSVPAVAALLVLSLLPAVFSTRTRLQQAARRAAAEREHASQLAHYRQVFAAQPRSGAPAAPQRGTRERTGGAIATERA
jgi:Methylamine utilisation protein MauE